MSKEKESKIGHLTGLALFFCSFLYLLIKLIQALADEGLLEAVGNHLPCVCGVVGCLRLIGSHSLHGLIECIDIFRGDDDAILAILDNLSRAVDISDDTGELHRACLHHGIGEAFAVAGEHEAVAAVSR